MVFRSFYVCFASSCVFLALFYAAKLTSSALGVLTILSPPTTPTMVTPLTAELHPATAATATASTFSTTSWPLPFHQRMAHSFDYEDVTHNLCLRTTKKMNKSPISTRVKPANPTKPNDPITPIINFSVRIKSKNFSAFMAIVGASISRSPCEAEISHPRVGLKQQCHRADFFVYFDFEDSQYRQHAFDGQCMTPKLMYSVIPEIVCGLGNDRFKTNQSLMFGFKPPNSNDTQSWTDLTGVQVACSLSDALSDILEQSVNLTLNFGDTTAVVPLCVLLPAAERVPLTLFACPQPLYNVGRLEQIWPNLLAEWVHYHVKKVGFDHFFIADVDGSAGPFLESLIAEGLVTYYPSFGLSPALSKLGQNATGRERYCSEIHFENFCMWQGRGRAQWGVVLHAPDEYLVTPSGMPLDMQLHQLSGIGTANGNYYKAGVHQTFLQHEFKIGSSIRLLLDGTIPSKQFIRARASNMVFLGTPHHNPCIAVHYPCCRQFDTLNLTDKGMVFLDSQRIGVKHFMQMFSNRTVVG